MSFADWSFSKNGSATCVATWETINPIQGTHSYSVNDINNASTTFAIGLTAGVNKPCGRVRCMNKQQSSGPTNWGAFGQMQTAFSVLNNAYCVTYIVADNRIVIKKGPPDAALSDNIGLANGTYSGAAQTADTVYALQINWQTVPGSGDILIVGSFYGPVADPNDANWQLVNGSNWSLLTTVCNYTDAVGGAYATGVTAGMTGFDNGGTARRKMYDNVFIFTD